MSTAEQNSGQASQPGPVRAPGIKFLGVYLKDMQLPPEVQKEVEDICREKRCRRARDRQHYEESIKLQYFFGWQTVGYKNTPQGLYIVLVGNPDSEEFTSEWNRLPWEERREIVLYCPGKWHDDVSIV